MHLKEEGNCDPFLTVLALLIRQVKDGSGTTYFLPKIFVFFKLYASKKYFQVLSINKLQSINENLQIVELEVTKYKRLAEINIYL